METRAFGGITDLQLGIAVTGKWETSDLVAVETWYGVWGPSKLIEDVGFTTDHENKLRLIGNHLIEQRLTGENLLGWVLAYLGFDRAIQIMAGGYLMAHDTLNEITPYTGRFIDWKDAVNASAWLPRKQSGISPAKQLDDLGKLHRHYKGNDFAHILYGLGVPYESIIVIMENGFTEAEVAPYLRALVANVNGEVVAGAIRSGVAIDADLLSQL